MTELEELLAFMGGFGGLYLLILAVQYVVKGRVDD